jgi:predicted aspartyl protease
MGVRVKVRIKYRDASLDLIALVNTGYETDVPEILVPVSVAEKLGLLPKLPEGTIIETYKTASGFMRVHRVGGAHASLLIGGVEGRSVETYIVISEYTDEVLISDQLASEFGIVIEDPAKGLWRLRGESSIRSSERSPS